jgi:hypothetical protein
MLSQNAIREIENQIERELRDARWSDDHSEKLQCYERIAVLRSTIAPQPTVTKDAVRSALLEILEESKDPQPTTSPTEIVIDLAKLFRRKSTIQ